MPVPHGSKSSHFHELRTGPDRTDLTLAQRWSQQKKLHNLFVTTILRAMAKKPGNKLVTIVMTPAERAALDAWRAKHQIWSRGDAIRRLVAEGIKRKPPKVTK